MSATSGRRVRARSSASWPSPASPTTSMSSCASRIIRKPARTSAWSSAMSTRIIAARAGCGRGRRSRRAGPGRRRACRRRPRRARASPRARGRRRCRCRACGGRRRRSRHHRGVVVAQDDRGARRAGVLARVRERLLDDPVQRQLDAARQRPRRPLDAQLDRHAGALALGHEVAEVADPRLRREPELGGVAAQHAEEPPELRERLAPGVLHGAQRRHGALGIAPEDLLRGARLHDHDAHRVRDDVVELARDPAALGGGGALDLLGALGLEPCGAVGERARGVGAPADDAAGGPAEDRPHEAEDDVVHVLAGAPDGGARRGDHDGQAGQRPRQRAVRGDGVRGDDVGEQRHRRLLDRDADHRLQRHRGADHARRRERGAPAPGERDRGRQLAGERARLGRDRLDERDLEQRQRRDGGREERVRPPRCQPRLHATTLPPPRPAHIHLRIDARGPRGGDGPIRGRSGTGAWADDAAGARP